MGELLGATIQTRFEDELRCQCLRVCRSARGGICFAVSVGLGIGNWDGYSSNSTTSPFSSPVSSVALRSE